MNSAPATRNASERKETALPGVQQPTPGTLVICPVCRAPRPKSRKWALYCSPKCRKAAYVIRKGGEASPSVIERLNRIDENIRLLADLRLDRRIADLERHLADIQAQIKAALELR